MYNYGHVINNLYHHRPADYWDAGDIFGEEALTIINVIIHCSLSKNAMYVTQNITANKTPAMYHWHNLI